MFVLKALLSCGLEPRVYHLERAKARGLLHERPSPTDVFGLVRVAVWIEDMLLAQRWLEARCRRRLRTRNKKRTTRHLQIIGHLNRDDFVLLFVVSHPRFAIRPEIRF